MNTLQELAKVVVLKQVRENRQQHEEGSSIEELCAELEVLAESAIEEVLLDLESEGKVHSREEGEDEVRWFPGTFEQEEDRRDMEEEMRKCDEVSNWRPSDKPLTEEDS